LCLVDVDVAVYGRESVDGTVKVNVNDVQAE
jgi:hypothetical protein